MNCTCRETLLSNGVRFIGTGHNCAYVADRIKLIPMAETYARLECGELPGPEHGNKWTRVFVAKMEDVCREKGVI